MYEKQKIWLGILAMVSVFGMTVVGCDDGSTDGSGRTDPALNGTWILSGSMECTYNNGNWEYRMNSTPFAKGTYTTNNGEMTSNTTHLWGNGGPYQLNLDAK